jgi:hypothetical protein
LVFGFWPLVFGCGSQRPKTKDQRPIYHFNKSISSTQIVSLFRYNAMTIPNPIAASATGTSTISKDTERVGALLYRYGSLPFEIASVLLLVAIIDSVMLARTLRQEASADDLDPEVLKDEGVHDPELIRLESASQE